MYLKNQESKDKLSLFLIMMSTGMASMIYEVVLISFVATTVGTTEFSSALVIAGFLGGLAIGAFIGGIISRLAITYVKVLTAIEILIAFYGFSFFWIVSLLDIQNISQIGIFLFITIAVLFPTILMGVEIPIGVRILNSNPSRSGSDVGFIYTADTVGGVIGALSAGIFLIPLIGLHGAMIIGGILNTVTAILSVFLRRNLILVSYSLAGVVLLGGMTITLLSQSYFYEFNLNFLNRISKGTPIDATYSPYQHIYILQDPYFGNSLYLDNEVQIKEKDSLLYHEFLTLPALSAHSSPKKVLVIGGGDGGVLFQLLQENVEDITHVDLDEEVVKMARQYLPLVHRGSLNDERVKRIITDGRVFLKETKEKFDVIIVDLPDPKHAVLAPLYSQEFYTLVRNTLNDNGVFVTQAQSPYYYLEAHTSILKSVRIAFGDAYAYTVPMSSFSSIGYVIAGKNIDPRVVNNKQIRGRRWYSPENHEALFAIPPFLRDFYKYSTVPVSTDANPVVHRFMQGNYFKFGIQDTQKIPREQEI
ncbi:spermidine synthase [candidate division KSB1 bacterium]